MCKHYEAVDINSSMESLVHRAVTQNFVPVVDDLGHFIGMVKRREIMNYLYRHADFQNFGHSDIMTFPVEDSSLTG